MKKTILSIIVVCSLMSCTTWNVTQMNSFNKNSEDMYGPACPNPIYVTTMGVKEIGEHLSLTWNDSDSGLSIYNLLLEAKKKYGNDVTIQNIKWDRRNKSNVSAIFDVIKCR